MSFSKAKIHRFNDTIPSVPSPGAYDPHVFNKSIGPRINKNERFFIDHRKMSNASSDESLCSVQSDKGSSSNSSTAFKTPGIPSTYRSTCRSDRRNIKSMSYDFLNKKSVNDDFEIMNLKYQTRMLEEEVTQQKNKNMELIRIKDEACMFLEDVINEKQDWVDYLKEKCSTVAVMGDQGLCSLQQFAEVKSSILERLQKSVMESDKDMRIIFDRYEQQVSDRDTNLEEMKMIVNQLLELHKLNLDKKQLQKVNNQYAEVSKKLIQCEKNCQLYEYRLLQQRDVIDILRRRISESDVAVDDLLLVVQGYAHKDGTSELIKYTEQSLLKRIDEYKEQASMAKNEYLKSLKEKDEAISAVKNEKDHIELKLQESLDQIEILKCREQVHRNEYSKSIAQFETDLKDYQLRLRHLEIFDGGCLQSQGSESETVTKFFELVSEKLKLCSTETSSAEEICTELDSALSSNGNSNRFELLQRFLNTIFQKVSVVSCENELLKKELARARTDFIEKCDEYAQMTRLLQISERNVDEREHRLDSYRKEMTIKLQEQTQKANRLEKENLEFKSQLLTMVNEMKKNTDSESVGAALKEVQKKPEAAVTGKLKLMKPMAIMEKSNGENIQSKIPSSKLATMNVKHNTLKDEVIPSKNISVAKMKVAAVLVSKPRVTGKENRSTTNCKLVKKTASATASMNSTFDVTSPKIGRI